MGSSRILLSLLILCKKCHTKRENCLCKKRKLSACRWVYQGGTHTLWVYTQLSVDSVSAPGWVYTREFTPILSSVWVLCLNSPYEFVVGLVIYNIVTCWHCFSTIDNGVKHTGVSRITRFNGKLIQIWEHSGSHARTFLSMHLGYYNSLYH